MFVRSSPAYFLAERYICLSSYIFIREHKNVPVNIIDK